MMKKMLKRIIAVVCCGFCLCSAIVATTDFAKAEEVKYIDMYLIAGQSNAAGYSPILDNETETFENVWYAGQTEYKLLGSQGAGISSDTLQSYDKYVKSVTAGLGNYSSRIGPEYGIAKTINDIYADSNRQAIIFKTAAGGTYLLDKDDGLSSQYGNWYPRSLWEEGYTPDISGWSENNDATGLLYELFVQNFKKVYNELVAKGYTPVIKGMAWMQGEQDLQQDLQLYGDTLITFIKDLRADLVKITGDNSLNAMPFVIGKIAPTFAHHNNAWVKDMHVQQERVATTLGNTVATVSTDDLIIVGEDENPSEGCPDVYHFCFKDAVTLGQRFGKKILELNNETLVTIEAENGNCVYEWNTDKTEMSFTVTPNLHYYFKSLSINGTDVTDSVSDGKYTFVVNDSKNVQVTAEFAEKDKLTITYEDCGEGGGILYTPSWKYQDDVLSLRVIVNDGYVLEKVTFDGVEMQFNSETKCYEVAVTKTGKVCVSIKKEDNGTIDDDKNDAKTGCTATVGVGSFGMIALVGAVGLLFRKKHN